ncbi:DNA sulfur modification protein DndB [Bacillus sp. N9]
MILNKELTPRELRINYIVGHAVFVEALGLLGYYLRKYHENEWKDYINKLSKIDWDRNNLEDWLGRAFNKNGRIQKRHTRFN